MNISTTFRRFALVAAIGMGAMLSAGAAVTFVHDGVIYKSGSGNNATVLTAQKAGTKVSAGEEAGPKVYEGDLVVPATIEHGGVNYTVGGISTAFKGSSITSLTIADGVAVNSRGCLSNCPNLKWVKLPSDMGEFPSNFLQNCTSLEEITIPGTVTQLDALQLGGCTSLKKVVLAESDQPIAISGKNAIWGEGENTLELLEIYRNFSTSKCTAMDDKLGRGAKHLTKVVIGGKCTDLPSSYFENSPLLKEVVFQSEVKSFGTNLFAGTGIEEMVIPEGITYIPASLMQNCKSLRKVTLGSAVETISDMAFYNSTLSEINIPATVKTIGQMAFSGCSLKGEIILGDAVRSIGIQAFANNAGITLFSFPAALASLGDGVFMGCTDVTKFLVDEANENFKASANYAILSSADDKVLYAFAPASAETAIAGTYTEIKPYAAYKAANVTTVSLSSCQTWGDYALSGTAIEAFEVQGKIGRFVASACPALKKLTIHGAVVPQGIAYNDAALSEVVFTEDITTIKPQAFDGCAALKELNLGKTLAILEADVFANSGITTLVNGAPNPAGMAEGVFTEESAITVKVPVDYVDVYKAAGGWKYLTIVGDANVEAGPTAMGMPAALYYAGEDGMLHALYADGQSDTYDVGGVPHTFQLAQFKNRIYGASAGQKFTYSATSAVDGDGKLFYISKLGNNVFQATVLDNTGGNAYKDPFGLYIYGDLLYVNDRNVCVRKIAADALSLNMDYPSWMENNWMAYYDVEWAYGCIKSGWAILKSQDSEGNPEPEYWVGMKYSGNGIYRFKEANIGTDYKHKGPRYENGVFMNSLAPIFTTFYIDEANRHLYIYMEKANGTLKAGVYRIDLDVLIANPAPAKFDDLNPLLVDGSPVRYEGSSTNEHVGISQFSPDEDGKYLYWCSRAATAADVANTKDDAAVAAGHYPWAEEYDASNPLHQSCIKRIRLGVDTPDVEIVKKDVDGYGIVPVNFEGSKKPADGVNTIVNTVKESVISINGDQIVADADAVVYVYDMAGTIVAYQTLAAGQSMSVAGLPHGAYIASANGVAVKFVK